MHPTATPFDRRFLGGLAAVLVLTGLSLKGLTGSVDLTGSWDELTYHYPSALHLAQNPFPDSLRNYPSATGPVAYLLAQLARPLDMDLVAIRWLTVLVTWLLGLSIFRLLIDRCGLDCRAAALYTIVGLLSPYVLGGTFLYMTDNYCWLFVLAWVYFITGYRQSQDFSQFGLSILFLSLAICTRQTAAWMVPISAYFAWRVPEKRAKGLALLGLGCLPLAALGAIWHGPTPPSALGRHTGIGGSHLRAATMALTILGFFGLFFVPWSEVRLFARVYRNRIWIPLTVAVGCLALLVIGPLAGDARGALRNPVHVDGYLLKLLDHGPRILDGYLLYLPFLLVGALILLWAGLRGQRFALLSLVLAIGVHLSNKIVYERYFELLVLVFLAWIFGSKWQETRWRVAFLAILFLCHPFFRYRASPTPFSGLDTSMYQTEYARQVRSRFLP